MPTSPSSSKRTASKKALSNERASKKEAMAVRRLPLTSLRVFVAIAEHLNFGRAADALGVSTAAVSMQLRILEDYLKVPLFRRSGRRVELTAEGQQLLPRVRQSLQDLEIAIDAVRLERRKGSVTISMLPSFLQQWLLPRLPDFHEHHPKIDLRLETSREPTDFAHSDVQVAIRMGIGPWPGLHSEKLLDEWLVPVCTPQMLQQLGPVESTRDLKKYRLLHVNTEAWAFWPDGETAMNERGGKSKETFAAIGTSMDDSVSAVRAAAVGQGLLLGRWSLVADEILQGRLAIASPRFVAHRYAYHFVCPPAYLSLEKVGAFRDWIFSKVRSFPATPRDLKSRR